MKTKHTPAHLRMRMVLPWIFYSILVVAIAVLQMSPRGFPVIQYARPTPLVLFVVCVALLEGPTIGSVMGVVAGLLWNLYSPRLFGYYGLILMAIGLAVGLLVQWLLRANFLSAMLLCVGAVIVYTTIDWLLCHVLFMREDMVTVLLKVYLPNGLYTILLSPFMYWVILWMARLLRRKRSK